MSTAAVYGMKLKGMEKWMLTASDGTPFWTGRRVLEAIKGRTEEEMAEAFSYIQGVEKYQKPSPTQIEEMRAAGWFHDKMISLDDIPQSEPERYNRLAVVNNAVMVRQDHNNWYGALRETHGRLEPYVQKLFPYAILVNPLDEYYHYSYLIDLDRKEFVGERGMDHGEILFRIPLSGLDSVDTSQWRGLR